MEISEIDELEVEQLRFRIEPFLLQQDLLYTELIHFSAEQVAKGVGLMGVRNILAGLKAGLRSDVGSEVAETITSVEVLVTNWGARAL